jgi:hypothetical protein
MSLTDLGTNNRCVGEGQQQFTLDRSQSVDNRTEVGVGG